MRIRILSIIALCFIIAASAYGGEKRDHRDSNDRPAAAQSSAHVSSSAASEARATPSATPPAGPARGVEQPRSYQGGIGYAPKDHETSGHSFTPLYDSGRKDNQANGTNGFNRPTAPKPDVTTQRPAGLGYRPGSGNGSANRDSGSLKDNHYFLYRQGKNEQRTQPGKPAAVAQVPTVRENPVKSAAFEPLRDRGRDTKHDDKGNSSAARPSTGYAPSHDNGKHDAPKVYSTGYSPRGTTYTIGYHRPAKITVPKTYAAPNYRQGRYYYPAAYHYAKPCYFGYWARDYNPEFCWRSVYFSFGMFQYVQISRIRECTYVSVAYVSEPLFVSGRYYLHNDRFAGLDDALADIRSAWISGRYDLIQQHVRSDSSLSVLTDGKYDYAISSADYLAMTHDAISDLDTVSFVWDEVKERKDGTATAFGEHSYRGSDGTRKVYVSYTLQKQGHDYYITEVGSSLDPLN